MKRFFVAGWRKLIRCKWWFGGGIVMLCVLLLGPVVLMRIAINGERFAAGDYRGLHAGYDVAIVLGAGVLPSGEPTPYLQRRLDSAVDLYKAGMVNVLLLSGDNSASHYNEPVAMQRYVLKRGVPKTATVLDYAGFNTYDSCYRANRVFGVEQAIVVSQAYHLPRAVWTCNQLGIKTVGVAAQLAPGSSGSDYTLNYLLREVLSSDKAVFQAIFKPSSTVADTAEYNKQN